ncbi:hypothetical protein [Streptomyces sp. NPDC049555]|uniref:hypothetical protein n=1 Tax=Streptomyces sp. NPDC049555 TaxID=3154930 RepID=UPI0034233A0C
MNEATMPEHIPAASPEPANEPWADPATARSEIERLQAAVLRTQVALVKGLTERQAARLIGATREELEADAEAFLAELVSPPAPPLMLPDPSQGSSCNGQPTVDPSSPAAFASYLHRDVLGYHNRPRAQFKR